MVKPNPRFERPIDPLSGHTPHWTAPPHSSPLFDHPAALLLPSLPSPQVVGLAKCNTAFVFPNAISVTTRAQGTLYFRTLLARGAAFRTILQQVRV